MIEKNRDILDKPGEEKEQDFNPWKWGIFYYDPADRRWFLPKKNGLGHTLNFARPGAVILFACLTVVVITYVIHEIAIGH